MTKGRTRAIAATASASSDATIEPRLPDAPDPAWRFTRRVRLVPALREVWRSREVVRSLAEREYRARYKQAVLGLAWALITPFMLMIVFTLFFKRVANVDTNGAPYPLFSYLGLLPWTFFSTSVSQGGLSLISNMQLLNKVYCPREVFPLASVGVAAVDTCLSTLILLALFVVSGFAPRLTSLWLPAILLVQVMFTIAVTLLVSATLVYLRDLRQALPILLQIGLFATPVAYSLQVLPPQTRTLYSIVNPLAAVIDSYRRTVLFGQAPQWDLFLPAAGFAFVLLVVAYLVFKRLETGFADIA